MLFPLTIAIIIVLAAIGLIYKFRLALARWWGSMHRQIKQDEVEMKKEFEDGRRNRG